VDLNDARALLEAPRRDLDSLIALRDSLDRLRDRDDQEGRHLLRHSGESATLDRMIGRKRTELSSLTALVEELETRQAARP